MKEERNKGVRKCMIEGKTGQTEMYQKKKEDKDSRKGGGRNKHRSSTEKWRV
jgi:hypothetical protein